MSATSGPSRAASVVGTMVQSCLLVFTSKALECIVQGELCAEPKIQSAQAGRITRMPPVWQGHTFCIGFATILGRYTGYEHHCTVVFVTGYLPKYSHLGLAISKQIDGYCQDDVESSSPSISFVFSTENGRSVDYDEHCTVLIVIDDLSLIHISEPTRPY